MYRRFHDRFGTAGLIVAVVALVAALAGTAIAAGGLTSQQKKEVTKIAKKYAGKPGPAGPQGATGAAGKDGTNGTNGTNGASGAPGADGKSVIASEAGCEGLGGTEFEVEGSGEPETVCNGEPGEAGEPGEDGSPWTADGTLPVSSTETGAWANVDQPKGVTTSTLAVALSFSIPLASELAGVQCILKFASEFGTKPCHVHYINAKGKEFVFTEEEGRVEVTSIACLGTAKAPAATSGNLCVYAGQETAGADFAGIFKQVGVDEEANLGASTTGATLEFFASSGGQRIRGTFAVTG